MARYITKEDGLERIKAAFKRYRQARLEGSSFDGREHLEEIQGIVDMVDAPFEFSFPQPDGVPKRWKFLPKRLRGAVDLSTLHTKSESPLAVPSGIVV